MKKYISRIDETCGKGKDLLVILKQAKREEAIRKILKKCEIERTLPEVLIRGKYKDKEISIFPTGKLIIKGLKEKKEAKEILEELLV